MGFRYRKSLNLGGGFRVNLSKGGVGYSWGTRGYRVTRTASGRTRTTYSIPGTGLSWVSEKGGKGRRPRSASASGRHAAAGTPRTAAVPAQHAVDASLGAQTYAADSGVVFQPSSENARDFLDAIQRRSIAATVAAALAGAAFLILLLTGRPVPALVAAALFGVVAIVLAQTMRVRIEYAFDPQSEAREALRVQLISALAQCQGLWQVQMINETASKKLNAGAENSARRKRVQIVKTTPDFVRTDEPFYMLDLIQGKAYLAPDRVILHNAAGWSVVEYSAIHASVATVKLAETEAPTPDSTIDGYIWRYTNADGSPDRRYRDNCQIPVCVRGQITFHTDDGFTAIFYLSSLDAAQKANAAINRLRGQY